MSEQHLDDPDVGILFQEMSGEAVPQRMRRHPLLDSGGFGGGVDSAVELTGRQRLDRVAAGKQPASRQQQPRRRPSRHQARSSSSSCGDSMAWRSFRPLPRSTRSSMRSESTSPTLSATTSETRSPAPYAVASAALYFGPGAACSSSITSSALSTAGSRRGWRTTVSRRARSGRSSVTVKKKRRAETALLILGGCIRLRLMQLEAAQIFRRRGIR